MQAAVPARAAGLPRKFSCPLTGAMMRDPALGFASRIRVGNLAAGLASWIRCDAYQGVGTAARIDSDRLESTRPGPTQLAERVYSEI
jgi:hypothetical protein